jgi:hypothetical protein
MGEQGYWIIIGVLCCIIIWLVWGGTLMSLKQGLEGFTSGTIGIGSSGFLAKYMPRRGDVGPELEQTGYVADKRYFHDYAGVQGFGTDVDYCRMVLPANSTDEAEKFFACALAGTEGLSSVSYRTPSVRDGFRLGRDDYMRDIKGDGLSSYCRVLKDADGQFKALCNVAETTRFRGGALLPDVEPPEAIGRLLEMYRDCVSWLRFHDNLVDYADNLYVSKAGGITLDEQAVNPKPAEGLYFNGVSGFLRIGDNKQLEFGNRVLPRNVRAFMFWVKFDEFTNNAHIFDFGDGAGNNNVFFGIIGRGDASAAQASQQYPLLCGGGSTLPDGPSGATYVPETTPQKMLEQDLTSCSGFTVVPTEPEPVRVLATSKAEEQTTQTASAVYEIWDREDRKLHVEIPQFFMKGVWTHVCIAALSDDPYRPDIGIYRNGKLVTTQPSGWLPQKNETTRNYIGRSNWIDVTDPYANKTELFKGYMYDYRMYNNVVSAEKIAKSYKWGVDRLGI